MEKNKLWKVIVAMAVVILLAVGAYFLRLKYQGNIVSRSLVDSGVTKVADENYGTQKSVAQEKQDELSATDSILEGGISSENFRIRQVHFGGNAILAESGAETLPIEIADVKNDIFSDRDSGSSSAVLTWKSNKLTTSEVEYSKSDGRDRQLVSEDGASLNHSIVLSELEQGAAYKYQIKSRDKWNNNQISDYYGFYTGSGVASMFELIGRVFDDTFGWMIK